MPVLDLTKTEMYRQLMGPMVEKHREELLEIGYDPDKDWELCAWMVWHWEKND